jgi:putative DNA primase/helicase
LKYFDGHRDKNYGIVLGGPRNVFVLEYDGAEGEASLKKLVEEEGTLPPTLTVETPRGRHYYFTAPAGVRVSNSVGRIAKGIDIRGERGFVVGPGSVHPSGIVYKFRPGRGPDEVEIAPAPPWLLKRLRKIAPSQQLPCKIEITAVDQKRAEAYARAAQQRELERLGRAPKHQRNTTLNLTSFKLGQLAAHGLLDLEAIKADLTRIAHEIGLGPDETRRTVQSGLHAGLKCPRNLAFLNGAKPEQDIEPPALTGGKDLTKELALLGNTDTDNATRFARRRAQKVVYTVGRGWMVYDGKRWRADSQLRCMELAKKTARLITNEVQYIQSDADKRQRSQFAAQSLSKASLDRMLDLAKGLLVVEDSRLDNDPWLLNTLSGTLDLKTGVLLPHDSRDLLTKIAAVDADMNAKCPQFKAFLAKIMAGDRPMMEYLRRAVGYTLTGLITEQVFFFCYGKKGANGKSTFVNLIRKMLGNYGVHTPIETLIVKAFDNNIPADLARLAGARMVTAIETSYNRPLDEAKIKGLTGGEPITARFMRQNYFEFQPECKIWFVGNDFPRVRATADAFWRRVHVISFPVELQPDELDRDLPTKLEQEWPGILAWAVRGCLDWQQNGLAPPPGVVKAVTSVIGYGALIASLRAATCGDDRRFSGKSWRRMTK